MNKDRSNNCDRQLENKTQKNTSVIIRKVVQNDIFFLIYEVSLKAKNRFLVQEVVCSVDGTQTTQTYTHESENRQKTPFKGVRNFSFNPSRKIHPT